MSDPAAVVVRFNAAINRRDLDELARLMTDAHRFIDSSGATVHGKAACVEAWSGFFDAFPDYRNILDEVAVTTDGTVTVRGRSECSFEPLAGPAEWRAVVCDGLVDVWQVS